VHKLCVLKYTSIMTKKISQKLKDRKIFKWLAIHVSTSLTTAGAINLLGNKYDFPPILFDIIVFASLCFLPVTLVTAWFHGETGIQKFRTGELIFDGFMVILFAFLLTYRIKTIGEEPIQIVEKSIAVLPFQNFSDSKEDEYFCDGVTEDILTQLSKIGDLKVVSRTSVLKYKDSPKTVREIAKELGVEHVLEGSVRRSGSRVRIVSQLVDARADNEIWSETYDRELKDIFQIQSDVAQKIANQLKAKLSSAEKERIGHKSTSSVDAYTLYLRGKEYYYRYSVENNEIASDFFRKAISLDSSYALAYSGLADAFAQRYAYFDMGKEWLDSSRAMSLIALNFDGDIAEPYKSLGVSYAYNGKYQTAIKYYLKAIEINPNFSVAISNLGAIYWFIGNYPEAKYWLEKSISLEVLRSFNYRMLGLVYQGAGDFTMAEKYLLKAIGLQPEVTFILNDLTKLYIVTNQIDKIRGMLMERYKKTPDDRRILSALGDVELYSNNYSKAKEYYQSSVDVSSIEAGSASELAFILSKERNSKADEIFSKLIKIYREEIKTGNEDFNYPYELARVFSAKNDKQKALEYLEDATRKGFRFYYITEADPLFKNIIEEPEFKKQMNLLRNEVQRMARVINPNINTK